MIKNLSVARKIVFIVAIVILPLAVATTYTTFQGFNKDISCALQELEGTAFLQPLEALLDVLPQHQRLAESAASGDRKSKEELASKEVDIDRMVADLERVQNSYGADLQFTEQGLAKRKRQNMNAESVKAAWQKLKQQQPQLKNEESAEQHKQLIATVRTMITHAGDTSKLTVDPDLDSSYLTDATLVTLPQSQDRLSSIASYGSDVLRRGKTTAKEAAQLAIYAGLLKEADLDRVNGDISACLNEDASVSGISPSLQRNLTEPLKAYVSACQEFSALVSAVADSTNVDLQQFLAASEKAHENAYAFWKVAVKELDVLLEKRGAAIRQSRLVTLLGLAVGLGAAFVLVAFVSRTITHPLHALARTTERILKGEHTARAPVFANDEIGLLARNFNEVVGGRIHSQNSAEDENKRLQSSIQDLLVVVSNASDGNLNVRAEVTDGALGNVSDALNLMLENVGELIANAKTASDKVATAASGINAVTVELEKGEQLQSKEISLTNEGVRDLNNQAQRVLQNCQAATQASSNARRAAEDGAKAVRAVILGMEKIRENTQANTKKIKRLGDRSMEISGIVKVIGDISAKTDMLALNASIEAARAGEQGRGFTIVAEQVRALADRTKTLTNQIEKLVNDIQQETAEAVTQMETQTQEVESGARSAGTAGQTLENIVSVSSQSSDLVAQINQAASRQATRTQEMLLTVDAINKVVIESQGRVRETRTTSEELAGLSSELNKRLAQFQIKANGASY